jgi:hypothetical protein
MNMMENVPFHGEKLEVVSLARERQFSVAILAPTCHYFQHGEDILFAVLVSYAAYSP